MAVTLPPNTFYVVSYPRSGNTWLINCLVLLLNGVRGEDSPYQLNTEAHGSAADGFQFWCEPRQHATQAICLKSHDDMVRFRQHHPPAPIVYIARDARDSLLSYYFFRQAYPTLATEELSKTKIKGTEVLLSRGGVEPVFEAAGFAEFLRTEAPLWLAHVNSAQADAATCYLTYEEFKADFTRTLERVAAHLQLPQSKSCAEVEAVYYSGFKKIFSGSGRDFFRRGEVGDWKNWFTPVHARLLDQLIGRDLIRLGFETDAAWATNYQPAKTSPTA